MVISFPILVLTSQLVIAVADDVPEFNIGRECRVGSTSAFDPNAGSESDRKEMRGCRAASEEPGQSAYRWRLAIRVI
jgi:hypothetical protein